MQHALPGRPRRAHVKRSSAFSDTVFRLQPDDMRSIGHRIRLVREAAGLKQSTLAAQVGMRQSGLSQVESGLVRPSLDLLVVLADQYGAPIDWVLWKGRNPTQNPQLKPHTEAQVRHEAVVVRHWHVADYVQYNASPSLLACLSTLPVSLSIANAANNPTDTTNRFRYFEAPNNSFAAHAPPGMLLLCEREHLPQQSGPALLVRATGLQIVNLLDRTNEHTLWLQTAPNQPEPMALARTKVQEVWAIRGGLQSAAFAG